MQPINRLHHYLTRKYKEVCQGISQRYWQRRIDRLVSKCSSGRGNLSKPKPSDDKTIAMALNGGDPLIILNVHLMKLCGLASIKIDETKFFSRIHWLFGFGVPNMTDRIYGLDLLDSILECPEDKIYGILLSHLVRNDDISMFTLPLRFNTTAEYKRFMEMCGL